MRITRIQIETLVVKIAQTRELEASCDECAQWSAHLAEVLAQSSVQDQDQQMLAILQHLDECIPCAQEFQVLCACERMDREQNWPSFEEMWKLVCGNE